MRVIQIKALNIQEKKKYILFQKMGHINLKHGEHKVAHITKHIMVVMEVIPQDI